MKQTHSSGLDVAVVGIGLRLPLASDAETFFERLCRGEEFIRAIGDEELQRQGVAEEELSGADYVKSAGYLDGRFEFDADFFGYSPREAEFMDPQLRLLHECCWEALESAGCDPELIGDRLIGLYVGSSQNMHWLRAVSQHVGDKLGEIYDLKMLYQREFFTTRVAYCLNLKGPALGLDTTCSTSLVAVHMAAQGLLSGDCDLALAGGVCVSPLLKGYTYHEGMIQSPDGHCRPFDAAARGTVPGQGVGVVALRRLEDAIADGNPIYAVLKSSAINNDGNDKVGYTAPSVSGQSRLIRAAMELAEVDADGIDFVECHGTATRIGDPIEVEALNQALGARGDGRSCLIGSVKSNVGHLDAAAGIVGFIKAVLSLKHGRLPPSLHYERPNPMIEFGRGHLQVNRELSRLEHPQRPLRAGVSSFGIGGTNAHAVLEEYLEQRPAAADSGRARLIPLSAKTPESLRHYAGRLHEFLLRKPQSVDALAKTLQQARRHHSVRDAAVATNPEELLCQLQDIAGNGGEPGGRRETVFMFSGQGTQYPGMTRELYRRDPLYRRYAESCLTLLPQPLSSSLRELLFGEANADTEAIVERTDYAQPLLFVVEYALARTLIDYGLRPAAMVGHSIGEYVAACLANVFALDDALALVCERGRLMAMADSGAMLSVRLSQADITGYLDDSLDLAAINSSGLVVVSGPAEQVAELECRLLADAIGCTHLKTSHAYHSRMMEPVLAAFRERVAATPRSAPDALYYSNVSGRPISADEVLDPDYWCRHLRETVRFAEPVAELLEQRRYAFIEIGPGNTLTTFVRSHKSFQPGDLCLHSVRHPRESDADDAVLMRVLGRLYTDGAQLQWGTLSGDIIGPVLALPTYVFAATTYDQVGGVSGSRGEDSTPAPAAKTTGDISHPRPKLSVPLVEAGSDIERRLCELWQNVFKLDRIGVRDNFFELGGHSLLATRLLADVREEFGAEVSLGDLFEQPCVQGLARVVEAAARVPTQYPPLVPADRSQSIPVSFQQRRLWMIDRLGGGSSQYNMPSPFILHGALDYTVVQAALGTLVDRHESLRTRFVELDGEPVQLIDVEARIDLVRIDLSPLNEGERERRQRELIREDALRTFDLACDLPVRLTVATLDSRRHLLLFNVHHIVSDGWSEVMLVKEFAEIYRALLVGRDPVLPVLTLQYADYAAWQRNWLVGETLQRELGFWRERLAGIPPVHALPLDRPRPSVPSYSGAMIRRKLPPALLQSLREFSQTRGATLFMTLQTVFALLLSRWGNSDDIVMGTPVAGRMHKPLEPLIGFFVNTLLLRNDFSGNPAFVEALERTKRMALSAFEHQHVPFEMLVDELAPTRSRSHAPLFQVLFALQNYERGSLALDGLELEKVEGTVSARFDLTLITAESPDGLFADWYYDTDLFDRPSIERMAAQFDNLLWSILEQPLQPVLKLPLIGTGERDTLLDRWQPAPPVLAAQCVKTRFEATVARVVEAPAIGFGETVLSYGELNRRVNRLAHALAQVGVGRGARVAICLTVGPDTVAAMLATLKCGAAYVPLDPSYPAARLAQMLESIAPEALIVDGSACVGVNVACPVLDLSSVSVRDDIAGRPEQDPPHADDASRLDDPAYVIFTSGSTGVPKGVVVSQRQMLVSLASREAVYPEAIDVALLLNSISFDSSVPTAFSTLLAGGCLWLCDENQRRDARSIAELIDRHRVSHILCLPSVYSAVLDFIDGRALTGRSLSRVILAAEMFTVAVKQRHFAHPTIRAALCNEYGPTECSVWSSYYCCDPETVESAVPIGRSPGHARLYVLNSVGELAPIGVEGELYIGGTGVADGYLHQPGLTAQRFLPDPFAAAPARMYRSGDLVRWRADGELEFLGRIDNQVKLRGYRIELSEIDTALERHSAVARAVSRVIDDRLISYIERATSEHFDISVARPHLMACLPDHMIPHAVVALDALPLLPNGKIDISSLPAWQSQQESAVEEGTAPRTAMEHRILDAWCEVLKIAPPSVDRDFFSLGGDSILLLKLSSQLNRQGLKFSAKEFYSQPTIEAMAQRIVMTDPPMQGQTPSQGAQLLHPIQSWFLGADPTDLHHFNQSVLLCVDADFDLVHIKHAVAALYRRHDVLRLSFRTDVSGVWSAEYREASEVLESQSVCEVKIADSASIEAEIERESGYIQQSLSLQGPLLKLAYLRLPDDSGRLLIVAHHLIVDGVSWRALLEDLQLAYRQSASGAEVALPARPVSFQYAVERLHVLAGSNAVRAELGYWQEILDEPVDRLRSVAKELDRVADERSVSLTLPAELTEALLTGSHRAYGMNIEEVLVAALRLALERWGGLSRIALMMEEHGRTCLEDMDVGDTVGWFTAAYPLVLADVPADPSKLLRDTKERLRKVPGKGNHYGLLKYMTDADATLDDRVLRAEAIAFNYLGQFDQTVNSDSMFSPAPERCGTNVSPRRRRDAVLSLDSMVSVGQLRFSLRYHRDHLDCNGAESLLDTYRRAIETLCDCWQQHDLSGLTPSDVPLLPADQAELDHWRSRWPALRDAYPATGSQQAMLYQSMRDQSHRRASFVNQLRFDLVGELDSVRLSQAWQRLPWRHDVFRSAFVALREDGIAQLLLDPDSVSIPFVLQDVSDLAPAEQDRLIDAWVQSDRDLGFDPASAPLTRVKAWRLAEGRHRLLWTTHHSIIDGWSLPLAFRSLLNAYLRANHDESRDALGFKRHVQWLHSRDRTAAEHYWRRQLEAVESPCLIAGDVRGSQDSHPMTHTLRLDAALAAELDALAREKGVTLYSVFQCGWAYLLQLYTGRQQVCFGSVVSGRPSDQAGAESAVGLFINTLPMMTRVDGARPLQVWIEALHRRNLEQEEHSYLSLPEILAQSPLGQRKELFNSVLVYENYPIDSILDAAGALRITGLRSEESTGTGLTLAIMPGDGLSLKLMYQAGEYSPAYSYRILELYKQILATMPRARDLCTDALDEALSGTDADSDAANDEISDEELLALLDETNADTEH